MTYTLFKRSFKMRIFPILGVQDNSPMGGKRCAFDNNYRQYLENRNALETQRYTYSSSTAILLQFKNFGKEERLFYKKLTTENTERLKNKKLRKDLLSRLKQKG